MYKYVCRVLLGIWRQHYWYRRSPANSRCISSNGEAKTEKQQKIDNSSKLVRTQKTKLVSLQKQKVLYLYTLLWNKFANTFLEGITPSIVKSEHLSELTDFRKHNGFSSKSEDPNERENDVFSRCLEKPKPWSFKKGVEIEDCVIKDPYTVMVGKGRIFPRRPKSANKQKKSKTSFLYKFFFEKTVDAKVGSLLPNLSNERALYRLSDFIGLQENVDSQCSPLQEVKIVKHKGKGKIASKNVNVEKNVLDSNDEQKLGKSNHTFFVNKASALNSVGNKNLKKTNTQSIHPQIDDKSKSINGQKSTEKTKNVVNNFNAKIATIKPPDLSKKSKVKPTKFNQAPKMFAKANLKEDAIRRLNKVGSGIFEHDVKENEVKIEDRGREKQTILNSNAVAGSKTVKTFQNSMNAKETPNKDIETATNTYENQTVFSSEQGHVSEIKRNNISQLEVTKTNEYTSTSNRIDSADRSQVHKQGVESDSNLGEENKSNNQNDKTEDVMKVVGKDLQKQTTNMDEKPQTKIEELKTNKEYTKDVGISGNNLKATINCLAQSKKDSFDDKRKKTFSDDTKQGENYIKLLSADVDKNEISEFGNKVEVKLQAVNREQVQEQKIKSESGVVKTKEAKDIQTSILVSFNTYGDDGHFVKFEENLDEGNKSSLIGFENVIYKENEKKLADKKKVNLLGKVINRKNKENKHKNSLNYITGAIPNKTLKTWKKLKGKLSVNTAVLKVSDRNRVLGNPTTSMPTKKDLRNEKAKVNKTNTVLEKINTHLKIPTKSFSYVNLLKNETKKSASLEAVELNETKPSSKEVTLNEKLILKRKQSKPSSYNPTTFSQQDFNKTEIKAQKSLESSKLNHKKSLDRKSDKKQIINISEETKNANETEAGRINDKMKEREEKHMKVQPHLVQSSKPKEISNNIFFGKSKNNVKVNDKKEISYKPDVSTETLVGIKTSVDGLKQVQKENKENIAVKKSNEKQNLMADTKDNKHNNSQMKNKLQDSIVSDKKRTKANIVSKNYIDQSLGSSKKLDYFNKNTNFKASVVTKSKINGVTASKVENKLIKKDQQSIDMAGKKSNEEVVKSNEITVNLNTKTNLNLKKSKELLVSIKNRSNKENNVAAKVYETKLNTKENTKNKEKLKLTEKNYENSVSVTQTAKEDISIDNLKQGKKSRERGINTLKHLTVLMNVENIDQKTKAEGDMSGKGKPTLTLKSNQILHSFTKTGPSKKTDLHKRHKSQEVSKQKEVSRRASDETVTPQSKSKMAPKQVKMEDLSKSLNVPNKTGNKTEPLQSLQNSNISELNKVSSVKSMANATVARLRKTAKIMPFRKANKETNIEANTVSNKTKENKNETVNTQINSLLKSAALNKLNRNASKNNIEVIKNNHLENLPKTT